MTEPITRANPLYWGDPIDPKGVTRTAGPPILVEHNETPSLRWRVLPDAAGPDTEDHVDLAFQIFFHRLVYLYNSRLRLRLTTAPGQASSGAGPVPRKGSSAQAHAPFLPGVCCTTDAEFKQHGMRARWVQLAGRSHLGKCFQTTNRLKKVVNEADTSAEETKRKEGDFQPLILREYGLELCRSVASGEQTPSEAFEIFCCTAAEHFEHLSKFNEDEEKKRVLEVYARIADGYCRVIKDPKHALFHKLLGFPVRNELDLERIDYSAVAGRFQEQVVEEMAIARVYQKLVGSCGQKYYARARANAFLFGFFPLPIDREAAVTLLKECTPAQEPLGKKASEYLSDVTADEEFADLVLEEIGRHGVWTVVKELEARTSPIKEGVHRLCGARIKHSVPIAFKGAIAVLESDPELPLTPSGRGVEEERALCWFLSHSRGAATLSPYNIYSLLLYNTPLSAEKDRRVDGIEVQEHTEVGTDFATEENIQAVESLLPRIRQVLERCLMNPPSPQASRRRSPPPTPVYRPRKG